MKKYKLISQVKYSILRKCLFYTDIARSFKVDSFRLSKLFKLFIEADYIENIRIAIEITSYIKTKVFKFVFIYAENIEFCK